MVDDKPKPPPSYMMHEGSTRRIPVRRDSEGEPIRVTTKRKRRADNRRKVRHG